jgi:FkbM family methyltransferase
MLVMKRWAKNFVRRNVKRLPWGIRDAAFDGLMDRFATRELLERLAEREGVTLFGCDGEFGRVISLRSDRGVLSSYCKTGTWARETNNFFVSFFAGGGGTYLDIGANIGLTTIPLARNPLIHCIAFEPDPDNFRNLVDNLRRNVPHNNVDLHEVALYHQDKTLAFSLAVDGNLGDHRIANETDKRPTIQVPGARLDDVVGPITAPLAAKIDVQGAEPFVLAGGSSTLARVEALAIEFSPYHMRKLDADGGQVLDYLADFRRLACVKGDREAGEKALTFGPAGPVLTRLRSALHELRDDEFGYLDVYGLRSA